MPWFHATFDRHIPSILKHGLGARSPERNFSGAAIGVYLAGSPEAALVMLVDWYFSKGNLDPDSVPAPKDFHASVRVIVIDDGRVRSDRLTHDESFPELDEIRRYLGVIDVVGMPVLTIDDVTPPEYRPGGAKYGCFDPNEDLAEIWDRLRDVPQDDPVGVPPPGGRLVGEPGA